MISKSLYTSKTGEWSTPQDFFDQLDSEFHFTVDVCASADNAKCPRFFTKADDGLSKSWEGERVWCNPPYGKEIAKWCQKAYEGGAAVVVLLVHARTDTRWFHDWVYGKAELRFIKGRLHFSGADRAPFPSMLAIFR